MPSDWPGPYRAYLRADGLFEAVPDRGEPSIHASGSAIDIRYDPSIPNGTFYLFSPQYPSVSWDGERQPPIWRESPWGFSPLRPSPIFRNLLCPRAEHQHSMADHVEDERTKALDFLADLLDGWCEEMGMNPNETWREPRIRERRAFDHHLHFFSTERVGMAVNNPSAVGRIVL